MILADSGDGSTLTGGTYGYEIASQLDALKSEDAAGLLLLVNTPGGSINGSKAMADAIERYQQRTGKKVVVHVQGMSASGGMYAMAGADEIIADYGSLIGSIGVIFGPFEQYKDVKATTGTLFTEGYVTTGGIEYGYLTEGKDKDFGNPFREMRAEERAVLQAGPDERLRGLRLLGRHQPQPHPDGHHRAAGRPHLRPGGRDRERVDRLPDGC